MYILKSHFYELINAALKEVYVSELVTGCSQKEILFYFQLLEFRNKTVFDISEVLEHIEHFTHRFNEYSLFLDYIRYHLKLSGHHNARNTTENEHMANKNADQRTNVKIKNKITKTKIDEEPINNVDGTSTLKQRTNTHSSSSSIASSSVVAINSTNQFNSTTESVAERTMSSVTNNRDYDHEAPIYSEFRNSEHYGIESDAHHMDMGFMEDDDYY